ncbi:MAG: hypothetical protein WD081_00920 [Gammaproteobacteria bacterium]
MNGWLWDAAWALGLVGVVLATIAGLWLLIAPARALAFANKLNREYSITWLQRALDTPRYTEPWIYRHHRVVGALLVLATAYFFWQLATEYSTAALAALFAGTLPPVVVDLVATVFTSVLVVGNAAGLVLGLVIFFRPSLLKGTEGWANRWIASEKATEFLDRRDNRPEGYAHQYPRRIGAIILAATTYIVLIILVVLP